jgi:hypothetical protein
MNCHECRQWIDDLLLRDPGEAPLTDVARHLGECGDCAREHALALETLETITPRARALAVASPRLKERILAAIPDAMLDGAPAETVGIEPRRAVRPWKRRAVRTKLAIALAAAVLLALILFPIGVGPWPSPSGKPMDLLARAEAAEARLFAAADIVGLTCEIVVEPLPDAALAEARWLPLISVGADGKPRYHQLKLGGGPNEGYTVRDESWYDPSTRRFAHVLSLKDRPLFANSYDGRSIHLLEVDEQGHAQLEDVPVAAAFQPPKDPSGLLGILAFMKRPKADPDPPYTVRDEGPIKLADGTSAHALRVIGPGGASTKGPDGYLRLVIRDDNQRVESLEFIVSEKRLFTVRRAQYAGRREPPSGWDLAGLRPAIEKDQGGAKSPVRALADMIRPDVTVEEMAKRADYAVYVFGHDPGWSARRQIADMLDLPSPPHRMFAVVYPAKDKRHVVLWQAHTFNANLAPKVHSGQLVYTSPAGIKVWNDKDRQKMADILLSSITGVTGPFSTAKDRTCYLLETPEGTFPALAVNGTLTDAELRGLVDSLVRAKPK